MNARGRGHDALAGSGFVAQISESAVSRVSSPQRARSFERSGWFVRLADWKSALQQGGNLRYGFA
jgi:hypothetical protein